jgi:hypothetical protein
MVTIITVGNLSVGSVIIDNDGLEQVVRNIKIIG